MKIALIGPGIMPIPPNGWGAVEILIWDYYQELTHIGHDVSIINTPNTNEIIQRVNIGHFDFVHLHYDVFYHILDKLQCPKIAITSHYPYIDQPNKYHLDGYNNIFQGICKNSKHYIFALSIKDYDMFRNNCMYTSKLFLLLNGSNHNKIKPIEINEKLFPNKSIYIGKVENRKKQEKYCKIPNIDFYGKCDNYLFRQLPCYKGEIPSHDELMNTLKNYGNLILLSDGENGTPLVIKEAIMAGLPIVTNRYSSNDLDDTLPFIDIIPDDKKDDLQYIQNTIKENLNKQNLKDEIRKYAVDHFSWQKLVMEYVTKVETLPSLHR
jgi:glycosyltransferase involved in cell wall biosynthesis